MEILQKNPFELCQIPGFGFKRVDAILQKNNYPLNSPMRIQGAIFSVLDTQKNDQGHLYCESEALIVSAFKLLNERIPSPDQRVPKEAISDALQNMILGGKVVAPQGKVYQTTSFVQEDETALKVAQMLTVPAESVDITSILEHIRSSLGIALSQRQSEAVYMAFRSNLSIITGSPGTGKTTVLRAIIEVFKYLYPDKKIVLAAPTGRASRRMAESTGRDDAKTLHSLLGLLGEGGFVRNQEKEPLDADLIIVDESSMIDMWLARHFFNRIRPGTKVILVGDYDQLQSVGAGDVFRELIGCGQIPVTRLIDIFRQKKGSLIAENAKRINENQPKLQYGEDFAFIKTDTQDETADAICQIYCNEVKQNGIEQVQILSPFRSDGAASVEQLNATLRELVNPLPEDVLDLKVGNRYFRVGDKIIQTKNNDKASNGDIGFIRKIGRNTNNELQVTIEFSESRSVDYGFEDMGHIEHAYATTIHKSQGSEYGVVIIPVIRAHAIMLKRNLIYTAITRAKQKVILIGQFPMLYMAIGRDEASKRNTLLGERISNYVKAFTTKEANLKKAS